jgi:uncharacterized delta-60 repeat protein
MVVLLMVLCASLALGATSSPSATSSTVVSALVPSATYLDATGCDSGVGSDGVLQLGNVLPGSGTVSTACPVTFGSSNNTSMLRVSQTDGTGSAMWAPPAGSLDGTWGAAGTSTIAQAGNQTAVASRMQRDGKLLISGTVGNATPFVARLTTTGALDPTFDGDSGTGDGYFTLPVLEPGIASAFAVEIDADGRIYLGMRHFAAGDAKLHVMRLLPDGRTDTSWGGDGLASSNPTADLELVRDIALQPDGKVLVAGCRLPALVDACVNGTHALVSRFDVNGSLDTGYASGGTFSSSFAGGVVSVSDIQIDGAGRAMFVGSAGFDSYVARLDADGVLDTAGFAAPIGWATIDVTAGIDSTVAVRATGVGVTVAGTGSAADDWFVRRYTSAGVLDGSFGSGGTRMVDVGGVNDGNASGLFVDAFGRSVVIGSRGGGFLALSTAVVRLTPSGSLDPTFSGDGIDDRNVAPGFNTETAASVMSSVDGTLTVVGTLDMSGADQEIRSYRYAAGPSIPDYADGSQDWETLPATSMFGVCLEAVGAGAAAQWPTTGSCPTADGTNWRAVPATSQKAASTLTGNASATASFRFGMRASGSQAAATYLAPISFDLIAPDA